MTTLQTLGLAGLQVEAIRDVQGHQQQFPVCEAPKTLLRVCLTSGRDAATAVLPEFKSLPVPTVVPR